MKRHSLLLTTLLLVLPARALPADPPFDAELKRLREDRDKSLAAAAEPINRRYQQALEALLRRATQAADLTSAIKIRDELQKLGVANPVNTTNTAPASNSANTEPRDSPSAPETVESLTQQLIGTKWDWFNGEKLTLLADGKANWQSSSHLWSWKVSKPGQRVIEGVDGRNGGKFTITFDRKLQTGKIDDWNPRQTRRLDQ